MTFAEQMDQKAKASAKQIRAHESELIELLTTMRKRRCFAERGYTGVFNYGVGQLKLSEAQAYNYKKVVEASEEIPELKKAIDEGKISLSQARRIVPVLTPQNHEQWISQAQNLKQKELELAVMEVNPDARPPKERVKPVAPGLLQVSFNVTPEEEKELRRVQDILSKKLKRAATLKEAILHLGKDWLKAHDPVRRAERLSSRKPRRLPPQPRGRQPLRAPLKHQIALRDRGQCTFRSRDGRRCEERRWLEAHHRVPISHGGGNTLSNVVTLCATHHQAQHFAAL